MLFLLGAGDWNLFCTLEAPLVAAIPQDSCEWRRSYGRATKSVYLEASFVKYNKDKIVHPDFNLLKRPIVHIYWTDCVVSTAVFMWIYFIESCYFKIKCRFNKIKINKLPSTYNIHSNLHVLHILKDVFQLTNDYHLVTKRLWVYTCQVASSLMVIRVLTGFLELFI